ncbi:hypothetical protein CBS101457_005485 [Exobasidium rhododendri]|nr:hypothetical protein CBS101457_005485 [Exobasidium rhododendri]
MEGATSAAAKRKSRPLQRKTSHSVIERRRRGKINEGLIHLQNVVPACRQELRELLECKVSSRKKNSLISDDKEVRSEVNRLLKEKCGSQMVLEKLCIISHTVEYVETLEAEIEAYRKSSRCDAPLPEDSMSTPHKQARHALKDSVGDCTFPSSTLSEEDSEERKCHGCTAERRGKRHWGSNHPMQLSKGMIKAQQQREELKTSTQSTKRKRESASQDATHSDLDDSISDLELDEWKGKSPFCALHLYTDLDQTNAQNGNEASLGLLAHVSVEARTKGPSRRLQE